jgi:hypothetical protein
MDILISLITDDGRSMPLHLSDNKQRNRHHPIAMVKYYSESKRMKSVLVGNVHKNSRASTWGSQILACLPA